MSIVVTGASGHFGRAAAERLLSVVPASDLILTTRDPGRLADLAARGVQVRRADFDHPETLVDAFRGADRMLLISTLSVGRRVTQHRRAIEAAVAAGVRHIAYTSFISTGPDATALVVLDHSGTEAALRESSVAYTFLRNSQYADAIADVIAPMSLSSGAWRAAAADGLIAPVWRQDCVDSAVAVLTTPGHENRAYDITGPELLSYRQAAALVAEVFDRPVEYQVITDDDLYAAFDAMGVPRSVDENSTADIPWCSDDMVSFERAIREGDFAVLSDDVATLTGRPARPLRDVLTARRDQERAQASTPAG